MIDDIEFMAIDRFRAWKGTEPNVLYYRDGVSTGYVSLYQRSIDENN